MKIAIQFPGQGSQYVGMASALKNEFSWIGQLYEEASESVKKDLLKLCLDGPESDLQLTFNAQPTILTTAYAWFCVIQKELDLVPAAGAGHSLGEYTALLASGAMTLAEAAKLVQTRGELMQSAVPVGTGKMAAVIGLEDAQIEALCEKSSEGDGSIVVPVNFNAPGQVVIAGHSLAVDRAQAIATNKESGLKARKFVPLNVSAPFHSPLMKPVREKFAPQLQGVDWKPINFPIVFNVDAQMQSEPNAVSLLTEQLDHPVKWVGCVQTLVQSGVTHFIEPGPGKVLTGLGKRIHRDANWINVESVEDLKKLEVLLKEG